MAGPAEDAGYAVERERGAVVVALPSVMATVLSHIQDHATLYDAAAAMPGAESFTGRGAAYRLDLAGEDCVVRHYRRGGAVAHVLRDEYLRAGEPRPLRELHASIAARQRGVDTPEVLAAIVYTAGPLYRADLATRYVPDSRDLADVTFGDTTTRRDSEESARRDGDAPEHSRPRAPWHAEKRIAAWRAAGQMLRTTFAAGVRHPDLNLRNILIARRRDAGPNEESVSALLIDLDKATVGAAPVSSSERDAMLARLHRSRRKFETRTGIVTAAAELAALEEGLADDGGR